MSRVSFLGLGAMGCRMASRFIVAGHEVTVFNRDAKKAEPLRVQGAKVAATARECAEGGEFVFAMVRDDEASRALWTDGETAAVHGLKAGQVVIESSTITPAWSRELAGTIARTGAAYVESPVAGSLPQVESGTLICLVGGDEALVPRISPVLKAFSQDIRFVGAVGQAALVKLMVNGFYLGQVTALAEIFELGERSGLERARLNELFQILPSTSPALKGILQMAMKEDREVRFSVELVEKDLRYLQAQTAIPEGQPSRFFEAVHARFKEALRDGLGARNISSLLEKKN